MFQLSATPRTGAADSPRYSLLGFLLGFRLLYRLYVRLQSLSVFQQRRTNPESVDVSQNIPPCLSLTVDKIPIDRLRSYEKDGLTGITPVKQTDTILRIEDPEPPHRSRTCPLCLEERTASAITECGHVFCWFCISEWMREKVGLTQPFTIISDFVSLSPSVPFADRLC
jgi:peroxin-10